jgi:DNA-binding NtrC family response regulator
MEQRPCRFECVFLAGCAEESQAVSRLLEPACVTVHHAATLGDAKSLLQETGSEVLLTELTFDGGTWEDARTMLAQTRPRAVLVVTVEQAQADERLWIDALERGAYDLILQPFVAEELQRILDNANAHARWSRATQKTRAAGHG